MNNGRRHPTSVKNKAKTLRQNGFTHREIARQLGTSIATAWLWTKAIELTQEQKTAINKRKNQAAFPPERRKKLGDLARVNLAQYWHKRTYTKEKLLRKIKDFYTLHGRIPLKREFNMYEEYRRRFGSWNNAIRFAGFEPNEVIFSRKFTAKDRHVCDSFAERIIDDWLSSHHIEHTRNIPYGSTKMTADFGVGNIRIEYFGLLGEVKGYDTIIQRKKDFCEAEGLRLIEIYPNDLFKTSVGFKRRLGSLLWHIKN